jgi:hypothetical protein
MVQAVYRTLLLSACIALACCRIGAAAEPENDSGTTAGAGGRRLATSRTGIRGAAIYLVAPPPGDPDGMTFDADAIVSIRCTWKFFISKHRYDIVVFHTLGDAALAKFKGDIGMTPALEKHLKFKKIEFNWPKGIDEDWLSQGRCLDPIDGTDQWKSNKSCGCTCPDPAIVNRVRRGGKRCWEINYLHMNRFFTYSIWEHLQEYDYYMRVDADLFIQREIPDPFQEMHDKKTAFAIGYMEGETQGCFEGQQAAVKKFAQEVAPGLGVKTYMDNMDNIQPYTCYWGGFHAGDVNFFRKREHMELSKYISEQGGIYTQRWSDQVHFPNALAILHPEGAHGATSLMPFFKHECPGVNCDAANAEHVFIHEHSAPNYNSAVAEKCMLDKHDKHEL